MCSLCVDSGTMSIADADFRLNRHMKKLCKKMYKKDKYFGDACFASGIIVGTGGEGIFQSYAVEKNGEAVFIFVGGYVG